MKKLLLTSVLVMVLLATAVLASSCSALGTKAGALQSVIIPSTGTAYVVTDTSTTDDPQGLRDKNFSTQDFINVWYQWDVQGTEKIISVGLTQFDLATLKGKDIKSATLQMYTTNVNFTQAARLVDISLVDGTWDAKTVNFTNKPNWASSSIASSVVYGAGVWTSWDVSASVAQKAKDGTVVSYAAGLDTMADKSQEQALFASQNIAAATPRLIVTYTASNSSLPMWVWIVGIVVIAIIAFLAGLMITRRRASKSNIS